MEDFRADFDELSRFMNIDKKAIYFTDMFADYEIINNDDFFHVFDRNTELCTLMFCADGLTDIMILPNFTLTDESIKYLPYLRDGSKISIPQITENIYSQMEKLGNKLVVSISSDELDKTDLQTYKRKYGEVKVKKLIIDGISVKRSSLI